MADERGLELGSGRDVQIFSSASATPVIVSSGFRPLQISSTQGSNPVIGDTQAPMPPTPITTILPSAVSTTAPAVQVNVVTTSGGVVIRRLSLASIQHQVLNTSTSTLTSSPVIATSGITIRSSASSATTPSEVPSDHRGKENDVTADNSCQNTAVEEKNHQIAPAEVAATSAAKFVESPSCYLPVATQPTTIADEGTLDAPPKQPQYQASNGVHPSPLTAVVPSTDSFIRAPSSTRSRPTSFVTEPPMTWSELTDRFDLVTVCGFALAVLAVTIGCMLAGDDLPFGWVLCGLSAISVGVFVKYRM